MPPHLSTTSVQSHKALTRFLPHVTPLEDRTTPAVITVTTLADTVAVDGAVSLREAIQSINAGVNINADVTASGYGSFFDQIRFTGLSGTISLTSDLDPVTKRVTISGDTGGGFAGKPVITIDGGNTHATFFIAGPNVTVSSLAFVRSRNAGVVIGGLQATGAILKGNHIGVDAAGTTAAGNGTSGIAIQDGATGAVIGGVLGQDSNVISGNVVTSIGGGVGISISGTGTSNNTITGNLIGTDATGTRAVGNSTGISILSNASNNTIGGTDASSRNVISGNSGGVGISDVGTSGNLIQGNYIGTDLSGLAPLGNRAIGVFVSGSGNMIGGTGAGQGNVIAHNGVGVLITTGRNSPLAPQGNQVLGNSTYANTGLGIDLGARGVTANDNRDADTGPNQLQNYPVITSVVGNQIFGTVNSTPGVTLRLEFFSNSDRDASGFGEGKTYLGTVSVTPDSNGNASFTFNAPSSLVGLYASATATGSEGTSEFGNTVLGIATPTPQLIPTPTPIQVPRPTPTPIPQAVPVLAPPLVATAGTPLLFPTTNGLTVASGIPTFTAGDIAPTAGGPQTIQPKAVLAVSQGAGGSGVVRVYNPDESLRAEAAVFPGFAGGIRIGTADVNGDGVPDGIAAAGPGGAPHVKVFSGVDGSLLMSFYAYTPAFTGGVFVAGGDLNGDGYADIITGAGAGGAPHVKVFDGATGQELASFYAYAPAFTGGVTVAAGDASNDGLADIVTGAGAGGAPHVKIFEATSLRQLQSDGQLANTALIASYFAFDPAFLGGVFVTAGADLNNDGRADVVVGAGSGGGPHVKVVDTAGVGIAAAVPDAAVLASFYAFESTFTGGVRVGEADGTQDGVEELVVGAGPTGAPRVRLFRTADLAAVADFYAFDQTFAGGVYVD